MKATTCRKTHQSIFKHIFKILAFLSSRNIFWHKLIEMDHLIILKQENKTF